jgi:hypothetical protein
VPNTPAPTAASLAALAVLLLAGVAPAQESGRPPETMFSTWPASQPPAAAPRPLPAAVGAAPCLGGPVKAYPEPSAPGPDPVQQARFQQRPYSPEEVSVYEIQIEPPGLERLIQSLQTDDSLQERIRQENRQRKPIERIEFPQEPILSRDVYYGRGPLWPERHEIIAPYFVCYNKLLFEEVNSERYGWELGVLQPFVSAGAFYADVVTLPYHLATGPFRPCDCGAGRCLPGDPVPYLLYPPEISGTGFVVETGSILAVLAIFP